MKKILTILVLSAVSMSAFAQKFEDPFRETRWDLDFQSSFFYNHGLNAPERVSPSGFGFEIMPIEMKWRGWKGGSLSIGILDMFFDWQYLQRGYGFTGAEGVILPAGEGKAHRFDLTLGFPLGFNHQFARSFGISLSAVPGIGFYSYHNRFEQDGVMHKETVYPTRSHVGFRLNLKATVWYHDMGVVLRYQPIASGDMGTRFLSVGIAFRN